jgi:uncharacterized protein YhjY with autotransporter beta-barrel domain
LRFFVAWRYCSLSSSLGERLDAILPSTIHSWTRVNHRQELGMDHSRAPSRVLVLSQAQALRQNACHNSILLGWGRIPVESRRLGASLFVATHRRRGADFADHSKTAVFFVSRPS